MTATPSQATQEPRPKVSVVLRGMTWDHSRGYLPVAATAQRFSELNPGVTIEWEKRSLRAFEEFPVERLAADYDLVVLDHPFVGHAAKHGLFMPLDRELPAPFLKEQAENSVGASHASYAFAGHQWALAIDAATPVAFWREDLMAGRGLEVPRTWEEMMALARLGRVEVPAAPINCLMNFYSLCLALGEEPFAGRDRVAGATVGREALARLRELITLCDPECWSRNPIASHELLSSETNTAVAYCPFAYGYSNYARAGYSAHRLAFGEPPAMNGVSARTTLGGTGLAVSALRPHIAEALAYAEFTASPGIQATLFAQAGGQPGHRLAWLSSENNAATGSFFSRTLAVFDRAYVRPRYCGHMGFQSAAGPIVHAALQGAVSDAEALGKIDALYRDSLKHAGSLT
jgi:multiple sugar transport system substrate-binding protein